MGSCNCKDLNVKSDLEVPSPDFSNNPDNLNHSSNGKKMKSFLKLKTQKNSSKNLTTSTEQLFQRGKTIKGIGNAKTIIIEGGENMTKVSSKNTNYTEKKQTTPPKRQELLRQHTEKNSVDYNIKEYGLIYSVSQKDINQEEENKLIEILRKHYLFQNFSYELLRLIVEEMDGFQVESGTFVYKEGEEGNCFFIIKSGQVEVLYDEDQRKIFNEGESFGEMALIQKCVRTCTLRALTDVEFYVIEGDLYRNLNPKTFLNDSIQYLEMIPWIKTLNDIHKRTLASLVILEEFESGQAVYLQNPDQNNQDKIYIIKQGLLSCRKSNLEHKKMFHRDYFGEKWVLFEDNSEQIPFDVFALEKSLVFMIHKNSIEEALGIDYKKLILNSFFRDLISKSRFFTNFFPEFYYDNLFKIFNLVYYRKTDIVYYTKNEMNKKIVFILEGALVDSKKYELIASKGEIFGEEILNSNEDLPSNLIAYPECIVFETSWDKIKQKLNATSLQDVNQDIFKKVNHLKNIYLFKHFSESRLLEISNQTKKEIFKPNEYIFHENTPGDKFFILIKGRVKVTIKDKFVRELEEGSCFGELSLLNEENRSATIVAVTNAHCYIVTKESFLEFIDDVMMESLKRKICLEDTQIKLSDLYYLSFIGKGKFGSVYLVHNGAYLYAIKSVPRKLTEKQKSLSKYIISEKKILLSLDHPFIIKLVKTLKTDNFFFFLMDFVNGINFEDYMLSKKVKKNLIETKFYGACLLIMISYLHSKNIIHRDLKPSNLILDSFGYLKLIDFGTAKQISDFTTTVIGTPHFMAPEILIGKGYSFSCDYWSVGITIYYIFYGVFPFGNNATDIMEIYKEILHKEFVYPEANNSFDLNSLLNILLSKRITNRMCKLELLSKQNFFQDFNWDDLINYRIKSPYIPKDLREWTSNLRNLNSPFENLIYNEKFDNVNYQQIKGEETPHDYNKNWVDNF